MAGLARQVYAEEPVAAKRALPQLVSHPPARCRPGTDTDHSHRSPVQCGVDGPLDRRVGFLPQLLPLRVIDEARDGHRHKLAGLADLIDRKYVSIVKGEVDVPRNRLASSRVGFEGEAYPPFEETDPQSLVVEKQLFCSTACLLRDAPVERT